MLLCASLVAVRYHVLFVIALQALRTACDERDNRISDLEVQALRNTSTLKMLSSALEVMPGLLLFFSCEIAYISRDSRSCLLRVRVHGTRTNTVRTRILKQTIYCARPGRLAYIQRIGGGILVRLTYLPLLTL